MERSPITNTGSLAPALTYWPGPILRCTTVPAIGAVDRDFRIDAALVLERLDVSSVKPRMRSLLRAASSAVCDERMSFCAWIRVAWPADNPSAARPCPRNKSLARLSWISARSSADFALFMRGHRRDEIVLRLHGVGGLDREQRLALGRRSSPGLRQKLGDPAGIGREHRRRAILVDRDLAFGDVLGPEGLVVDRLDGQARPFGTASACSAARPCGTGWRLRSALVLGARIA